MVTTTHWQLLQVHPLATQAVSNPNDFISSLWMTCSETCDPENQIHTELLTGCDSLAVKTHIEQLQGQHGCDKLPWLQLAMTTKMPLPVWWHFTRQSDLISFATAYSWLYDPFVGSFSGQQWCLKELNLFFFPQQPFNFCRKILFCASLNLKPKLRESPCNHSTGT